MEVNISIADEFKGKVTQRWLRNIAEQVFKAEKAGKT